MRKLHLDILDTALVEQIINEAIDLLVDPGIRIHNEEGLRLLADTGARINVETRVANIPETVVQAALKTAPSQFDLYALDGTPVVHYGGDCIHFDPGSTALTILDASTLRQRQPDTLDLVKLIQLVETLPALDAQSTAIICQDVPAEIGDLYRLYIALNYMNKPIITGAFRKDSWWVMKELLEIVSGGCGTLAERPLAVFDVCPSPPLLWSDLTCQNLIDCARSRIPAELVSMPLAGTTAPVTLAAAVIQHAAENLSGLVIHQLAFPGAPIVWGGSPAALDMRHGTTPMGDVGTWLIDCAYAQVGKTLGLPTHAYLGMTDSKIVDAQAGMETSGGMLMAALTGINMISGAGMMDFETCQSLEKLVIDAEMIGMYKHLVNGIQVRDDPIALDIIRSLGHRADYLALPHTSKWFSKELYLPSDLIERGSYDGWQGQGGADIFERAKSRVAHLLTKYQPNQLTREQRSGLCEVTTTVARKYGMDTLPQLPSQE